MKIWERKYVKGNLIALLIILSPMLVYLHLLFNGKTENFEILGIKIHNWLNNNEIFFWMLLNDIVPLVLLLAFFFTTLNKWRYLLLVLTTAYFMSILYTLDVFQTFAESVFSFKALVCIIIFVLLQLFIDLKTPDIVNGKYLEFGFLDACKNIKSANYRVLKRKIVTTKRSRSSDSLDVYLKKVFYLFSFLEEQANQLIDKKYEHEKNRRKNNLNSVFVCLFILMIFLWFMPYLLPSGVTTIEIFSFEIHSHGFNDVMTLVWFASRKLIVVLFLSIWFIDSPYWWRYAILSPLFLFSYQFWETFQETSILDSFSNLRVLPLVLLNIVIVLMISKLVKNRTNILTMYEDIHEEIETILEELKSDYPKELAKTISELKSKKSDHSKAAYREQLKALEQELSARLEFKKGSLL
ncbi:hypothetical protein ACA086_04510 [Muriicola sp. E247]|uniref:hypothetical protein n=1 Tax=Muriicola sp. E247 TaxID=3242730 RepID=UPI0035258BC3